jgi:23S rRNA (guanosine2251-2'-O)-methyltransferase
MGSISPRDRFITVYGRMPVMEALADRRITIDRVFIARQLRGEAVADLLEAAAARGVEVQRVTAERVTRISRNGRHDQGVVADIEAPHINELSDWLAARPVEATTQLLVLDGVTNPSNVGLIVRSATAAGMAGVVVPRSGSPEVGPLVIKASAGVALFANLLRSPTAASAVAQLRDADFTIHGLRAADAPSLWEAAIGPRAALVLGNETTGLSPALAATIEDWVAIPLAGGVESLNVAAAAAVVSYELARRRSGSS